ncbi:MAG: phage head closure protein [Ignavibacteriaceae bacterium]|nr:phage head closure protein [Ignavibacteriaceae bacterium]
MRHRVDIQEFTRVQDSNGISTDTWANVATSVPAQVYPLSGNELIASEQTIAQSNVRIVMYKRTINEAMRIVFDGRNYDIKSIIPDPTNNVYITLMCKTGYTNG